jgi:hypothetical protein
MRIVCVCGFLKNVRFDGFLDVSLEQLTLEATTLATTDASFAFALFPSLFVLSNLSDQRVKRIIDAHSCFGRCLNKRHAILLCDLKQVQFVMSSRLKDENINTYVSCLSHIYGPCLQITFVAHQNHRHLLSIFHTLYLFTICSLKEKPVDC